MYGPTVYWEKHVPILVLPIKWHINKCEQWSYWSVLTVDLDQMWKQVLLLYSLAVANLSSGGVDEKISLYLDHSSKFAVIISIAYCKQINWYDCGVYSCYMLVCRPSYIHMAF